MIKEIQYTGYEASTPDNLASDGSLSAAVGLVNQDGGMRAATSPNEIIKIPDGYEIVFRHRVSSGQTNTILRKGQTFSWFQYDYEEASVDADFTDEIEANKFLLKFPLERPNSPLKALRKFTDINAIGNTLIILYGTPFYVLWKGGKYNILGSHIPTIKMSLGLQGGFVQHGRYRYIIPEGTTITDVMPYDQAKRLSEHIQSNLNPLIEQYSKEQGKFTHPFFIQYAIKTYDGRYVNRSTPIYMQPCIYPLPINFKKDDGSTVFYYYILMLSIDIDYMLFSETTDEMGKPITTAEFIENIKKWGDIIESIDFFVSKPLYFYKQDFVITGVTGVKEDCISFFNGKFTSRSEDLYCSHNLSKLKIRSSQTGALYALVDNFANIPVDWQDAKNQMMGANPCYLVSSIKIDDIQEAMFTNRTILNVDIPRKKTLEQQPTCENADDYDFYDNDQYFATGIEVYNNSASLLGLKRSLFNGFGLDTMLSYCNESTLDDQKLGSSMQQVYVKIESDSGSSYILRANSHIPMCMYTSSGGAFKFHWGNYLSFPNPNATWMWIGNPITGFYKIRLNRDQNWNRAHAYLGFYNNHENVFPYSDIENEIDNSESTNLENLQGKVYSSITNNPFVFRPSRAISFDGADVIGMASATKALSQGQFGQFPMYAFTSDGIWALEVSASTGGYSAKQPVTRDVCINPLSITQGDNCIYFVSDRGLMLLSGSDTSCISDILDDHFTQSLKDTLPGYGKFLGLAGVSENAAAAIAFRDFIKEAQIIYDYTNQRLIVFKPATAGSTNIAYAYSLASRSWTFIENDIYQKLNSYPEAIGVSAGGGVVNISTITDGTEGTGFIVTRPLSLDMPEVHKTVDAIIQRGKFRKGCIKQALWGSRDLIHWHLVASSDSHILRNVHGTPYKWFRIGVIATLKDDEALTGCSINYTPKLTNKIR